MASTGKRKILRVGIIQSGRIVEERLIRKRENVTIGQASKNTFIVPASQLARSYTLFEAKSDKYFLVFDDTMEGRVSVADEVVDLRSLARSGNAKKRGGRYVVQLDEKSRGKVIIGDFTLLFQFIDAPPVLPKPQLPAAARGGLAQRVEWAFVYILVVVGLIMGGSGVGLDIWWRQTGQYLQDQFGQKRTKAYEVLRAEVLQEKAKEPEPEEFEPEAEAEAEAEGEGEEPIPVPEVAPKPKPKAKPKATSDGDKDKGDAGADKRRSGRSKDQIKAAVSKKTWLHKIGSEGSGEGAFGPNTLKDGVATAKLDDAFRNLDGGVATAEEGKKATFVGAPKAVKTGKTGYQGLKKGEAGGQRIATTTVKTSTKEGASGGGEIKVRGKVGSQMSTSSTGTGKVDHGGVSKVFSRRKKAIQHCYEKGLQKNNSLSGKVVIKFTIGPAGRVTTISVVTNSTGDSSVGQCIVDKVKTWKFPQPEGGSVTFKNQFVLSKG